ncbi:MAG: metallophosphoesterase [Lachnospiraceae bacterium]|nr:metallophosphoesterase [Lachnospiraceae bacterium]
MEQQKKDKSGKVSKKKWILYGITAVILVWLSWSNVTVQLSRITVSDADLPTAFEGYKIAQISDLHNAKFGKDNNVLIQMLEEHQPDIIVITGDMVDSNHTDVEVAIQFARRAAAIAPCYYVTGNHEGWLEKEYERLEAGLLAVGVDVMHDEAVILEKGGDSMQLIGVDDPTFRYYFGGNPFRSQLQKLKNNDEFTVLLSHRPELFETYVKEDVDIVFTGHAHGGQVRIPFVGGVVAPGQGFLPEYDAGIYTEGTTTMVVSRGIGNSVVPVRVNNRPEIVIVELQKEETGND